MKKVFVILRAVLNILSRVFNLGEHNSDVKTFSRLVRITENRTRKTFPKMAMRVSCFQDGSLKQVCSADLRKVKDESLCSLNVGR